MDVFKAARLAPLGVALSLFGAAAWADGARADDLKTLYSFCKTDCRDGKLPLNALTRDASGNLYGTTHAGGSSGQGTVFELERAAGGYKLHTLYSLCSQANCDDGNGADKRLVIDSAGNLYGTVSDGTPSRHGGIFKLSRLKKNKWRYTLLYSFCALEHCADGVAPMAGLSYRGAAGGLPYDGVSPLYGTTSAAGSAVSGGTVFALSFPGDKQKQELENLYTFCPEDFCKDGGKPLAPVTLDADGNIYGTTSAFGPDGIEGHGTVFQLTPKADGYRYSILYAFRADDGDPLDGVTLDAAGNLYGTSQGGPGGTLYKLQRKGAKKWRYVLLHAFCTEGDSCDDGGNPLGGLTLDADGDILGTAEWGGPHLVGVIFKQHGSRYSVLHAFEAAEGGHPYGGVVLDEAGNMYGAAADGDGKNMNGAVFEFTP